MSPRGHFSVFMPKSRDDRQFINVPIKVRTEILILPGENGSEMFLDLPVKAQAEKLQCQSSISESGSVVGLVTVPIKLQAEIFLSPSTRTGSFCTPFTKEALKMTPVSIESANSFNRRVSKMGKKGALDPDADTAPLLQECSAEAPHVAELELEQKKGKIVELTKQVGAYGLQIRDLKKRLHRVQRVLLEERLSQTAMEQRADVAEKNSKGLESRLKNAEQRVKAANHIVETTKNRTRDLGMVCSYQAVKVKELANMINLFLKKLGEYRTKNKLLRKFQINPDHFSAHPEFVDLPFCGVANKSISLQQESHKVHDSVVEDAELANPQSGRVCHLPTVKSLHAKKAIQRKQHVQVTKDVQDSLSEGTELTDLQTESISELSTERYLVIKKGIERRQHTQHAEDLEDIEMTDSQSASISDLPAKKAPCLKKARKRRERPQGTNQSFSIEAACCSQPLSLVKANQEYERNNARLPLEIGIGKGSLTSGSENKEPTTVITTKTSHFVASLPLTSIVGQSVGSRSPSSQCKSPSISPSPSIRKMVCPHGDHTASPRTATSPKAGSDKAFAVKSSAETPETVSLKDSDSCKISSICHSPQNLSSKPTVKLEKGCSPRSFASETSFLCRLLPMKKIIDDSIMFSFPDSGIPTTSITQDSGYMTVVHQFKALDDIAQELLDPCESDCSQQPVGKALQEQDDQFSKQLENERYPHPRLSPAEDKGVEGLSHQGDTAILEEGDGLNAQGDSVAGVWPANFMQQSEVKIDSQRSGSVSPKDPEFPTINSRIPSPSSSVESKGHRELEEQASVIPLCDILSLGIGDDERSRHRELASETNGEVKVVHACPNGCETQNSSVPSPIYSDLLHAKCPSPQSPVASSVVASEKSCKSCAIQGSGGSTPVGSQQQQRATGWKRFFAKSEAYQTNTSTPRPSFATAMRAVVEAGVPRITGGGLQELQIRLRGAVQAKPKLRTIQALSRTTDISRIKGGGLAELKTKTSRTVVHAKAGPPQLKLRLNTVQETFVQEDEEKSVIEKRAEELSKSCIHQARKLEEVSQQLQQFPVRLDEQLKRWAALEAKRKYEEKVQALAQESICNYGEEGKNFEAPDDANPARYNSLKPSTPSTRPSKIVVVQKKMADTPRSMTRGKTAADDDDNNNNVVDQLQVVRMMKAIADVKVTFLRMRLKKLEHMFKSTTESQQPYKQEVEVWRVGSKLLMQTISLCFAISRLPSFIATLTSAPFPT